MYIYIYIYEDIYENIRSGAKSLNVEKRHMYLPFNSSCNLHISSNHRHNDIILEHNHGKVALICL